MLVSNDLDWSRAITGKTHWMARKDGRDIIYTRDTFYADYGFYPGQNEVCLYKALRGDAGDNIPPGVKNIPETIILDIIRQAKSVGNMFLNLSELDIPAQWKSALWQCRGRIRLNFKLVSYRPLSITDCRECAVITEFNKEILSTLYRALNFNPADIDSRLRETDEFSNINEEDFFKGFEVYNRAE